MKKMIMAADASFILRKPQVATATKSSSFSKVISRFTHTNPLSHSPLLMQPGRLTDGRISDQFYNPCTRQVIVQDRESTFGVPVTPRIFASSRGWLGFVDTPEKIHVSAPSLDEKPSSGPIRLPSVQTINCIESVKCGAQDDRQDFSLVVQKYSIKRYDDYEESTELSTEDISRDFVRKIVLTCDPFSESEDCGALFLFGEEIAFCNPGKDNKWKTWTDNYEDMIKVYETVYSRKDRRFYHVFNQRRLGYRDGIESGDIFLVNKYSDFESMDIADDEGRFYVWKLDLDRVHRSPREYLDGDLSVFLDNYAEPVDSIGDLAFFIGPSNYECFALSVNDFPALLPNSIYYIDDHKHVGVHYLRSRESKLKYPWDSKISHEKDEPFWVAPRG